MQIVQVNHEHVNKLIYTLGSRTHFIPSAVINYEIPDEDFHPSLPIDELNRLNLIEIKSGSRGESNYLLKSEARIAIQKLPRQFENDPYGYFLDEEQKEKEQERQTKWYLAQDAKQRFDDYPIIKNQRNWAIAVSIIGIISSIVLGIL